MGRTQKSSPTYESNSKATFNSKGISISTVEIGCGDRNAGGSYQMSGNYKGDIVGMRRLGAADDDEVDKDERNAEEIRKKIRGWGGNTGHETEITVEDRVSEGDADSTKMIFGGVEESKSNLETVKDKGGVMRTVEYDVKYGR